MSEKPNDSSKMEKWLETYFLDPLTTYLDHMQFRIDLYETDKKWIVEAVLPDFESSEITVYINENELIITATKKDDSHPSKGERLVRKVEFPFQIIEKKVTALFSNGTLEVFISKTDPGLGKNRFVTLP
ncbi:Hsp20/alpha crystallin family protein [Neobacillus terrae]|uniref:Hsp20/alpha crystallin family protein n=1 Tax=Neobacillus terrae TaxID=3034837 RepID=UPI00140AFE28|nr:Hsp20/alpha crystallin family protein [Neobacillus terrae]NHM31024.1 Hsp20/alpha crystallin family protein [Neobacillus terrae]